MVHLEYGGYMYRYCGGCEFVNSYLCEKKFYYKNSCVVKIIALCKKNKIGMDS